MEGIRPCGFFVLVYSYLSLLVEMIMRCFSISLYMWVTSFCICKICLFTLMSSFVYHSLTKMYASRMVSGRDMYFVFQFCLRIKIAFIMFL